MEEKPKGRPKGTKNKEIALEFQTEAKTYAFFKTDINKMQKKGWTPKEIFRLGIYAKENNPNLLNRLQEVEKMVNSFSSRLTSLNRRLYEDNNKQIDLITGFQKIVVKALEDKQIFID